MPVIDFQCLNQIDLQIARQSIARYCSEAGAWFNQFDNFFNNVRVNAPPDKRMTELLEIVRCDGWNMSRRGQCTGITKYIDTGKISDDQLIQFWAELDNFFNIDLRKLPCLDKDSSAQLTNSIKNIRIELENWHSNAGTVCFLTKVILMFNWGQSPAYDTRIRKILKINNNITDSQLVQSLKEIGTWLRYFEVQYGVSLDQLATEVMRLTFKDPSLNQLPLGRSFDMMLFHLPDVLKEHYAK
jgi:hypothetical protein